MKKRWCIIIAVLSCMVTAGGAWAHFGMVIPSDSMVVQGDDKTVRLQISFSHPFEIIGMDMARPKQFAVMAGGTNHDLLDSIHPVSIMGHSSWQADYKIQRPGVYIFYAEPQPYWEPAEDCYIIHYTKTVVTAFGDDEGWDREAGLKTEIVPLSKPFGLYAGNVFQGIVKLNGRIVPYAEVEVEFYNQEKKAEAPTDYMITQTVKADADGVFTYGVPKAGWWGFAALNEADFKLKKDGEEKDVELGAVIWVRFHPWE